MKKEPHSSTAQIIRDQFMDNIMGQTGMMPGPIVISFLPIDKQTDRIGPDTLDREAKPNGSEA